MKLTEKKMIEMVIEAYVMVEGQEKWNSLSEQEQHDVIMGIMKSALNAMD